MGVTDFTPDKLRGKAPNGGEGVSWVKPVFLSNAQEMSSEVIG